MIACDDPSVDDIGLLEAYLRVQGPTLCRVFLHCTLGTYLLEIHIPPPNFVALIIFTHTTTSSHDSLIQPSIIFKHDSLHCCVFLIIKPENFTYYTHIPPHLGHQPKSFLLQLEVFRLSQSQSDPHPHPQFHQVDIDPEHYLHCRYYPTIQRASCSR